jgi:hypothetical protein
MVSHPKTECPAIPIDAAGGMERSSLDGSFAEAGKIFELCRGCGSRKRREPKCATAFSPGARTFVAPAQSDGSRSKLVIAVYFQRMLMTNNCTLFLTSASF